MYNWDSFATSCHTLQRCALPQSSLINALGLEMPGSWTRCSVEVHCMGTTCCDRDFSSAVLSSRRLVYHDTRLSAGCDTMGFPKLRPSDNQFYNFFYNFNNTNANCTPSAIFRGSEFSKISVKHNSFNNCGIHHHKTHRVAACCLRSLRLPSASNCLTGCGELQSGRRTVTGSPSGYWKVSAQSRLACNAGDHCSAELTSPDSSVLQNVDRTDLAAGMTDASTFQSCQYAPELARAMLGCVQCDLKKQEQKPTSEYNHVGSKTYGNNNCFNSICFLSLSLYIGCHSYVCWFL